MILLDKEARLSATSKISNNPNDMRGSSRRITKDNNDDKKSKKLSKKENSSFMSSATVSLSPKAYHTSASGTFMPNLKYEEKLFNNNDGRENLNRYPTAQPQQLFENESKISSKLLKNSSTMQELNESLNLISFNETINFANELYLGTMGNKNDLRNFTEITEITSKEKINSVELKKEIESISKNLLLNSSFPLQKGFNGNVSIQNPSGFENFGEISEFNSTEINELLAQSNVNFSTAGVKQSDEGTIKNFSEWKSNKEGTKEQINSFSLMSSPPSQTILGKNSKIITPVPAISPSLQTLYPTLTPSLVTLIDAQKSSETNSESKLFANTVLIAAITMGLVVSTLITTFIFRYRMRKRHLEELNRSKMSSNISELFVNVNSCLSISTLPISPAPLHGEENSSCAFSMSDVNGISMESGTIVTQQTLDKKRKSDFFMDEEMNDVERREIEFDNIWKEVYYGYDDDYV